jgi:hypothetical protein
MLYKEDCPLIWVVEFVDVCSGDVDKNNEGEGGCNEEPGYKGEIASHRGGVDIVTDTKDRARIPVSICDIKQIPENNGMGDYCTEHRRTQVTYRDTEATYARGPCNITNHELLVSAKPSCCFW